MTLISVLPNSIAGWYKLVNDAQNQSNIILDLELENYLINLLQQYLTNAEITNNLLSFEFLNSINSSIVKRENKLRETGDKCLVIAGLFPGYAEKRNISVDYFLTIGQSAYSYLSMNQRSELRKLFYTISDNFNNLTLVLNSIEKIKNKNSINNYYSKPNMKERKIILTTEKILN